MTVKYGKFEIPEEIKVEELGKNSARFIAEPLERGFGHTVGNAMRRILLTSIESPAIVAVLIEGVTHEYQAIEGVLEDVTNIVLNLKGASLRRLPLDNKKSPREQQIISTILNITKEDIEKSGGQYAVTLGGIATSSNFEIMNPELVIFTVSKPFNRRIDIRVAFGRGYVTSEQLNIADKRVDEILIDASYSPVILVNYKVENTRVGRDTDFDKLILDVKTDGRITPQESISFAYQIALLYFTVFENLKEHSLVCEEEVEEEDVDRDQILRKLALRIDEIELSVRSTNCLKGANIETIAELVSIPERRMLEFRNFGKKSLTEIRSKLLEMSLNLGMDLSKYGISQDNVKEKVKEYQNMFASEEKLDAEEISDEDSEVEDHEA
jgi:DNA-directed RNA polymerase subunit alpha